MINKLIYTYWTNSGTNFTCGFPTEELFISFLTKSVQQSKLFFESVQIYTDQHGYDKLKNKIEAIYVVVDYSIYNFDERFWNFPKLVTYNLQQAPFIHIDCDVILFEKPNGLDADIITEKERGSVILSKDVYPLLPEYINKHVSIVCSGLLGGNNINIFKELFSIASEAILDKEFNSVKFNNLVAIEEIVITHLIKKDSIIFEQINQDYFVHFQGRNKANITQSIIDNLL